MHWHLAQLCPPWVQTLIQRLYRSEGDSPMHRIPHRRFYPHRRFLGSPIVGFTIFDRTGGLWSVIILLQETATLYSIEV